MRTYDIILDGTKEARLTIDHKFLLILSDEGFSVDLAVLKGSGFAEVKGVQAGFGLRLTDQTRGKEFIFRCANPQTIKVFVGDDEALYNRLSGNVTINGVVRVNSLRTDPVYIEDRGGYGASWGLNTNPAANTSDVIVAPGSNLNGIILHSARFWNIANTHVDGGFVAKASPPVNPYDGDSLCGVEGSAPITGNYATFGKREKAVFIAPGKGLYYVLGAGQTTAGCFRSALYTVL